MNTYHKTASSFRQGARTLPGEYYTSPGVLAEERDAIFARRWCCAGRASRLQQPGDYVVRDVAGESILVVRGRDEKLRAFFNVCRHRGTRLCGETAGRFGESIQCPYHAWTYAIDGRLIGAPHMDEVDGFDKGDYPLHQAAIAESNGFIFVNISRAPRPFGDWFGAFGDRLHRFQLDRLVSHHSASYTVQANWKLVFQNYSECLHCPVIHPELASVIPYQSGANDLVEGPFLGGYMEITPPNQSVTASGGACGAPVSTDADDGRRAFYYSVMPNMLLSIHPDYVNYYILTPLAADRTLVESEWLFNPEQPEGGRYNPGDAISLWETVNRQDWDIVERSQLGIGSCRYTPGPYSPRESIPAAWDREYLKLLVAR